MTQTAEPNIERQRAALEGRLAELQSMNGLPHELINQAQAALNERKEAIANVQRQLDAIDVETGARARQQRAEAERTRLQRIEVLRAELVEQSEQRSKAVADAEVHARALAEAFRRVIEANAAMSKAAYVLTGEPVPVNFGENDLVRRLSARLGAVMSSTISRVYRSRFGHLEWRGATTYPVDQNWAEAEERAITPAIISVIERKKDH
jgi:hypothetical protein